MDCHQQSGGGVLFQLGQPGIQRGGRARSGMQRIEIKLFVGGMNAIIRQAKSDQQRIQSKNRFKQPHDGDTAAFAHVGRLLAKSNRQRFDRKLGGRAVNGDQDRGTGAMPMDFVFHIAGEAGSKHWLKAA